MSKLFYPKLACINIRKNAKTYIPYLITCICTITMYFLIRSLSLNSGLGELYGSGTVSFTLELGANVAAVFAFIFLFYTNSFLIKGRKKEFGLYNILGMEKRHLVRILFYENLFTAVLSLVLGIAAGALLNKLAFLGLTALLQSEIPLGFEFSVKALMSTLVVFGVLFLLIFLNSFRQIHLAKPVELLSGGQVGEREPKTKWLSALLGALSLGGGYYIALTVKNPVSAIALFFVAVLLVIAGTYLLFEAGSILLLKILRKKKSYYYKTKHFISVSGMLYRMKQNAAGLSNICILSTMVLVMVSSTLSLYLGMGDMLTTRYPRSIILSTQEISEETSAAIRETAGRVLEERQLVPERVMDYTSLEFTVLEQNGELITDQSLLEDIMDELVIMDHLRELFIITQEDFLAGMERQKATEEIPASWREPLAEEEVLFYANRTQFPGDEIPLFGRRYQIKEKLPEFIGNGSSAATITSTYFLVVKDRAVLQEWEELEQKAYEDSVPSSRRYYYGFDLDVEPEEAVAFYDDLKAAVKGEGSVFVKVSGGDSKQIVKIECQESERQWMLGTFGGFFFIGLFLGLLFIMATILIIYYKQISEGYDDKKRFEIMQKVGLTRKEVKKSIHSQVLTLFFLPLLTAGVHVAFAFPVIRQIMMAFSLDNTALFAACTVGSFLVFALCYVGVYLMTTKVYYRIVSWER